MPEVREDRNGAKYGQRYISMTDQTERTVHWIDADAIGGEEKDHPPGSHGATGFTYRVSSTSRVRRGAGFLFPQFYQTDNEDVSLLAHGIQLISFEESYRSLILRFKDNKNEELWLQVQTLTHTNLMIYDKEKWLHSVGVVRKDLRGFKVMLAIGLDEHVIAFNSMDGLCHLYWARSRSELPDQHLVVHKQPKEWLSQLAEWIDYRHQQDVKGLSLDDIESSRDRNVKKFVEIARKMNRKIPRNRNSAAMLIIRDSQIFPGVGVYTICELFHRAGLIPNVTEAELFDSVSRVARLCAAYFTWIEADEDAVWASIDANIYGHTFAVETGKRLDYLDFLKVYGKERTKLTRRQADLIKKYEDYVAIFTADNPDVRHASRHAEMADPFEPDLVRHALEKTEFSLGLTLGSLIFGEEKWRSLSSKAKLSPGCATGIPNGPLTEYFKKRDTEDQRRGRFIRADLRPLSERRRRLDLDAYDQLFTTSRWADTWVETKAYRDHVAGVNVWSAWAAYPKHLKPDVDANGSPPVRRCLPIENLTRYTRQEKAEHLLSHMTQHTNQWTVGPFDFCGIAKVIPSNRKIVKPKKGAKPKEGTRSEPVIAYCLLDPHVPMHYHKRLLMGMKAKLRVQGPISDKDIEVIDEQLEYVRAWMDESEEVHPMQQAVKRRLNLESSQATVRNDVRPYKKHRACADHGIVAQVQHIKLLPRRRRA